MGGTDTLETKLARLSELLDNARDEQTDVESGPFRCSHLQGLADHALVHLLRDILLRIDGNARERLAEKKRG